MTISSSILITAILQRKLQVSPTELLRSSAAKSEFHWPRDGSRKLRPAINTCPRGRGTKLAPLAFLLSNSPNQCPVKLTHRVNKLICPSRGAEIGDLAYEKR